MICKLLYNSSVRDSYILLDYLVYFNLDMNYNYCLYFYCPFFVLFGALEQGYDS